MATRIGLIGCGTIGRFLAERLVCDPDVAVVAVLEPDRDKLVGLERYAVSSVAEMAAAAPQLVVEAATAEAVWALLPTVLEFADAMVLSVCAFCDAAFEAQIREKCRLTGHLVWVPHGAILGLDGICDSRGLLESVTIETTKRPRSLGRDDPNRTVVFSGPTREACRLYPRNVNVHAAVALAGLGFDKTTSILIADPDAESNRHVIAAKGAGFRFCIEVVSEPKSVITSAYTTISAYNSVKRLVAKDKGILFV